MEAMETISSLGQLAYALAIRFNSNKTYVEIKSWSNNWEVIEYFDSGKGHSGAFSSRYSKLDQEVFREALEKGYIVGKRMPGYVSKMEFVMTQNISLMNEINTLGDEWYEQQNPKVEN